MDNLMSSNDGIRAEWFKRILDRSNDCYNLRAFVYNMFGKSLYANQYLPLRDMLDPTIKRIYFTSSRQSGKTEAIALFQAIFPIFVDFIIPHYDGKGNCYIFAPKQEQAQISFERFSNFVHFNEFNLFTGSMIMDKSDRVKFQNGADVRAITASRNAEIEGLTTHIIILDECVIRDSCIYTYVNNVYKRMTIENIVNNKLAVAVCSYNKEKNVKEYKKIVNYFKKPLRSKKLYKIKVKTDKGVKELKCTGEHKVCTSVGMVKAKNLTKQHKVKIK